MGTNRYRSIVGVHLLLIRNGRVLLGERHNTGFGDGLFHTPAGHLERNETVVDGMIREAKEELGIVLDPARLECVHVMHHRVGIAEPRIAFFFASSHWEGEPENCEPTSCLQLQWFFLDQLPKNMVNYAVVAIDHFTKNSPLSIVGWDT